MTQFHENTQTDKDGRMEGRMDSPYFIGPLQLPPRGPTITIDTIEHGMFILETCFIHMKSSRHANI